MKKQDVCSIYNDIAEWFDTARNKTLIEKENLDFVLSKLQKQAAILDLGCGTAEPIAKYLIEQGCQITGIDGSAKMINFCKHRYGKHTWIHTDMRSFDLEQKFDAIIAWDSLFHIGCNDQRNMFSIFDQHIKPGGILMFTCGWEEAEYWNKMRGHEDIEMFNATLNEQEYRDILEKKNFNILKYEQEDPDCGGRTYWIAQKCAL